MIEITTLDDLMETHMDTDPDRLRYFFEDGPDDVITDRLYINEFLARHGDDELVDFRIYRDEGLVLEVTLKGDDKE